MHAVIWEQCSESMKARLRVLTGFKDATSGNDCFWILQQIKSVTLQFNEKRYGNLSLTDARWNMLNCRQQQDQSVAEYKEILKGWADAIDFHGGTVAERLDEMTRTTDDGTIIFDKAMERVARERTLAAFIRRSVLFTPK